VDETETKQLQTLGAQVLQQISLQLQRDEEIDVPGITRACRKL
jgi:hypothetical protein